MVWWITGSGVFRKFSDLISGSGTYQEVFPRDVRSTLEYLPDLTWDLKTLDGTVTHFRADGSWESTTDRNGNVTAAASPAVLPIDRVNLPDGRALEFGYASGKLETLSELDVDDVVQRTWTYSWVGDDLTEIVRPDLTKLQFSYNNPDFPGYMTRMDLVPTDAGSARVLAGWEYDSDGNVIATWSGDSLTDASGDHPTAASIDDYTLSFDDPASPTVTTVTNPTGGLTTYSLQHLDGKTRIDSIDGDCPSCGLAGAATFTYNDPLPQNAFLPTAVTDAAEQPATTAFAYDANGQVLTRTEDTGGTLERTTTWVYDTTFPTFPTLITRDSAVPGCGVSRSTAISYTATGDVEWREVDGCEEVDGLPQPLPASPALRTEMDYTGAGQPLFTDPPDWGAADRTTWTYHPAPMGSTRTLLNPATRTDSLLGTTLFEYDTLNRRVRSIDPNGLVTDTQYDSMDRVLFVIQRGVQFDFSDPEGYPTNPADLPEPGDLATQNIYNVFGDLAETILPAGNKILYGYETAPTGRLKSIERRDADGIERERTFYEVLDNLGNRTLEKVQHWDGAQFVTKSETASEYSVGGCHLTKTTVGMAGSGAESVTEYAYDCNGNLEKVWDANHPSMNQTATPTQTYTYDALDRLTTIRQPWGGGGAPTDDCDGGTTTDAVTCYDYDVQDHLTSVEDAERNVTSYHYSDRDLLTTQISIASGTTTYNYDLHGELVKEVDARGAVTERFPDAADRVLSVTYRIPPAAPNPALTTTYDYTGTVAGFSFGRLIGITRNGATVDYGYDLFGRLTTDGELTYGYDPNGNRTTIAYPSGLLADYGFDFADREETLEIDDGGGAQPIVTAADYLPSGPLESLTLASGVTETRAFDSRYYPASIDVSGLRRWTHTVDAVGNILQVVATASCEADVVLDNETLDSGEVLACQDTQCFLTQGVGRRDGQRPGGHSRCSPRVAAQ